MPLTLDCVWKQTDLIHRKVQARFGPKFGASAGFRVTVNGTREVIVHVFKYSDKNRHGSASAILISLYPAATFELRQVLRDVKRRLGSDLPD